MDPITRPRAVSPQESFRTRQGSTKSPPRLYFSAPEAINVNNFFIFGRRRADAVPPQNEFLQAGFVYGEERLSPDGTLRVLLGHRDGERSATLIEPRIVVAATGEVLLDLWRTYKTYEVVFSGTENGRQSLTLTIQDAYTGAVRTAVIDMDTRTFVFADAPQNR